MATYALYLTVALWCFVGGVRAWRYWHPTNEPLTVETIAYVGSELGLWKGEVLIGDVNGAASEVKDFEIVPTAPLQIHISYNSLTDDRSKFRYQGRYFLMGTSGYKVYRCEVSREYWENVSENSHYYIPASKCVEIKP